MTAWPNETLPGPSSIEPGLAPGGIVFRVYGSNSNRLLGETRLTSLDGVEAIAEADRAAAELAADDGEYLYLVAFDGDTGDRLPIPLP